MKLAVIYRSFQDSLLVNGPINIDHFDRPMRSLSSLIMSLVGALNASLVDEVELFVVPYGLNPLLLGEIDTLLRRCPFLAYQFNEFLKLANLPENSDIIETTIARNPDSVFLTEANIIHANSCISELLIAAQTLSSQNTKKFTLNPMGLRTPSNRNENSSFLSSGKLWYIADDSATSTMMNLETLRYCSMLDDAHDSTNTELTAACYSTTTPLAMNMDQFNDSFQSGSQEWYQQSLLMAPEIALSIFCRSLKGNYQAQKQEILDRFANAHSNHQQVL